MGFQSRSSGERKYLATNSTQGSLTLTAGRTSVGSTNYSTSGTITLAGSAHHRIVPLDGYRGARLKFFGVGNDNTTPNYRIFTVQAAYDSSGHLPPLGFDNVKGLDLAVYGSGTFTLSTALGAGTNDLVATTERMADTITFTLATSATTPSGPATLREAAYQLGNVQAYSPADNTEGELIIPDFGSGVFGFLIEFDIVTNVTSLNATYELTR